MSAWPTFTSLWQWNDSEWCMYNKALTAAIFCICLAILIWPYGVKFLHLAPGVARVRASYRAHRKHVAQWKRELSNKVSSRRPAKMILGLQRHLTLSLFHTINLGLGGTFYDLEIIFFGRYTSNEIVLCYILWYIERKFLYGPLIKDLCAWKLSV